MCIFCESKCKKLPSNGATITIDCPSCGHYQISSSYLVNLESELDNNYASRKHLVAGFLYEFNRGKNEIYDIKKGDLEKLLDDGHIPKTPMQRLDRFLLNLYKNDDRIGIIYEIDYIKMKDEQRETFTSYFGNRNSITILPLSIAYARNIDELKGMINNLESIGFIQLASIRSAYSFTLSPKGLEQAEQLMKLNFKSNTVFVAMWFNESEMAGVYDKAIKVAIEDKQYYDFYAIRIDKKEHNNDITDEIIAEIKSSKFVVADLTGYRGGVYYEAGYARGLGREVILTCRKDWFDGNPNEYRCIHFDVSHFPIIVWEPDRLDSFKEALINRIRHTIL